jgi:hypothetical protein
VGLAAIIFSAVYFASDLIEVVQGDFSTGRLSLTYVGEAAIPLFVIGLYAVQRPRIGWLGLFGATAYLMARVVLVAAASGLSNLERTIAAAFPATAFTGMGIALLHRRRTTRPALAAPRTRSGASQ